jgi:hypothetical protein
MCSNKKDIIAEPKQKGILYKIEMENLAHIIQSIPIYEETTALLHYYRYVFLVSGDYLIKMETHPELEELKTVAGYRNTKLIAGADGKHIFVIKDGKLIKLNFELEPVPLPDDAEDSGWEGARLMEGAGHHIYIVRGDDLIKMNGRTLKEDDKGAGWTDANSLTAPGNSFIYLFRNDELIRLKESDLKFDGKSGEWDGTALLTGSGRFLFIVRNGELICLLGNTLQRNKDIPVGSDREDAALISAFNEVYIIENFN